MRILIDRSLRRCIAACVLAVGWIDSGFAGTSQIALLTSPAANAWDVPVANTVFQWSGASGAKAYRLTLGTTPGAKDVLDSGILPPSQVQITAYQLPLGRTLYATLSTELTGIWRPFTSTFTTAPRLASLLAPANGATDAAVNETLQWTATPGAQAYYVDVGTSPGKSDVVNSGGLPPTQTTYTVSQLPQGRTLYATIWAQWAGNWYSSASSFATASMPVAALAKPQNQATYFAVNGSFQWSGAVGAQGYVLCVGTRPGAADIVNSGKLAPSQTSYAAKPSLLPWARTLYATIWTKLSGTWWPSGSVFTTSPQIATLINTADGATDVGVSHTFKWNAISGAQGYYLDVGTTPGASDVVNTGGIQPRQTSFTATQLPRGRTLYATVWTELSGTWLPFETSFSTVPQVATLTSPANGANGVDPESTFTWTAAPGAQGYILYVGTTPGAHDLVDVSESAGTTSYAAFDDIPAKATVYVTVWTEVGGAWFSSDTTMATTLAKPAVPSAVPSAASTLVFPTNGAANVEVDQPFQWTYADSAGTYWLVLGTSPGDSDVADTGPIHVPGRFLSNLPLKVPIYGQLYVKSAGSWTLSDTFSFSAAGNQVTTGASILSAFWATDYVRQMADINNKVNPATVLENYANQFDRGTVEYASCGDYTEALMTILEEMGQPLDFSPVRLAFNTAGTVDGHVLLEVFNPDQQEWMLLDPTFDLTVKRTSDGGWATAEDMEASARARQWGLVNYVYLSDDGDVHALDYYIDYPLLYLNIYHGSTPIPLGQGWTLLPYFTQTRLPHKGYGIFAIRTTSQSTVNYIDSVYHDTAYATDCDGIDSFSALFVADSVFVPEGDSTYQLYVPNRYVFLGDWPLP
jgi:hypothetical protein